MVAQSCCSDAVAGTAPATTKLTRPSASLMKKARKLRKKAAAGGKRTRAAASRQRVVAIRRKMEALRRLVPLCADEGAEESGGERRLDELLLHAAGYILRLQMQVRVMQVMVHALNNLPED